MVDIILLGCAVIIFLVFGILALLTDSPAIGIASILFCIVLSIVLGFHIRLQNLPTISSKELSNPRVEVLIVDNDTISCDTVYTYVPLKKK